MPIRIVPDFEREGEAENPIVVFSLLGLIVGFFLFVVRGRRGEDDGRARRAPESMNERSARAFETWAPSSPPPPGGTRRALESRESRFLERTPGRAQVRQLRSSQAVYQQELDEKAAAAAVKKKE